MGYVPRFGRHVGSLAAAFLLSVVSGHAQADTTLTVNAAMPRTSAFFVGVLQPWKEAVERESNGHIKIYMPSASLAPLPRQWEMVTTGIADVAITPNDFIREKVKLPFLAEIPFLAPNSVADSVAIWRTQEKYFAPANEFKDVKLLALWVNGGNTVQTLRKPVTSMDDFKGLKVWVPTPNLRQAIAAFGGTPVAAEQATGPFDYMSGGIVDGAVTGIASLISYQLSHYTKQITYFQGQLGYNLYTLFMSKKKYESLAPDDKAAIDRASYENMSRTAAQGFVNQDNAALPLIAQNGIQTHQASPEFMAALKSRIGFFKDNWMADAKAKGIDGPAAYEYFAKTSQDIAVQVPAANATAKQSE
jgi:TRAP-type C4-dicarboxylate transport system substrate-binding protein